MTARPRVSDAVRRLHLPERREQLGVSVREADRHVSASLDSQVMDTTHFDTVRFPPPPWASEAFITAAADGRNAYTPYRGSAPVLESVAGELVTRMGVLVDPEQNILISPGTQAGLFSVLSAVVSPGDRVALFDPDYLFSERILRFLGATVHPVPLVDSDAGLAPDLDELERAFRAGATTVLFSHPNNPTGALYPPHVLDGIAALVREHDALAVVDELYARLVYDQPFSHLVSRPGMRERCVTITGPSKTESLSGYRIGVVVAPQAIVDAVEDVLSAMALRAPAYSQHLLTRWLRDDEQFIQQRLGELRSLRDHTLQRLAEVPELRVTCPPATAYLFVDATALKTPDHILAERLVRDAGVLISPGYQFGARGVGSFRLCYARDETLWDEALTRMNNVFRKLSH
ncbi:pyridoxal phosphate-dependent aminotransferase [Streptomyces sp. ME19-01-6]|uniref:pyridoxal phosphate-dependent aminotransferase n=1 Tax=Streptomyces sp. ME19-01-6 TaxID=3028686 RepID=UPI0029ACF1E2|nr:aminotransferase class I/II-fold pyridoxal phosphate-dependent enzyme [Streptomyces sp. ME19-01-6]MDX3233157.1 aminotransferase class I/II-fold pyridoxal phosphate-dependent enzyme [Streptomyces sp. ME19-01-6]